MYKQYKNDVHHPTAEMKNSKAYFAEHRAEIIQNLNMFADEQSNDVYKKMIRFRCTHNVRKLPEYILHNSYFVEDIVPVRLNEVFVDCGAFTGDTVKAFIKYHAGNYKKIVCFEPDSNNYKSLIKNTSGIKNVHICRAGVWSKKETLRFVDESGASSRIMNSTDNSHIIEIPVQSNDGSELCNDASFIKMDIEGAEYEALRGAELTIRNNLPILSICIYHSNEDMVRLPQFLKSLNLNYNYYVRQLALMLLIL